MIFNIFIDGSRGPKITRTFEYGCYTGVMAVYKPQISTERIDSVPYRIFTAPDREAKIRQNKNRKHAATGITGFLLVVVLTYL